ncbi:MAG: hypothetical protein RL732_351 [Bacteroidota bacterium]|jgi:hypothetical protein
MRKELHPGALLLTGILLSGIARRGTTILKRGKNFY